MFGFSIVSSVGIFAEVFWVFPVLFMAVWLGVAAIVIISFVRKMKKRPKIRFKIKTDVAWLESGVKIRVLKIENTGAEPFYIIRGGTFKTRREIFGGGKHVNVKFDYFDDGLRGDAAFPMPVDSRSTAEVYYALPVGARGAFVDIQEFRPSAVSAFAEERAKIVLSLGGFSSRTDMMERPDGSSFLRAAKSAFFFI